MTEFNEKDIPHEAFGQKESEEDFIKIVALVKEMLKEDGLDENQDYVIVNICW